MSSSSALSFPAMWQYTKKNENTVKKIQTISKISVAISIIVILSGVFLASAAHQILPHGFNAISNLGVYGYIISYGIIGFGIITSTAGIVKILDAKNKLKAIKNYEKQNPNWDYDYADDLPKEMVGNLPAKLKGKVFETSIPIILQSTLDLWINEAQEDERELRKIASEKIIKCFQKRRERLKLTLLTSLPDIFNHLPYLRCLRLCMCHLNTFPESIRNLKKLERLLASGSHLETLPDSISAMENLQHLDLECNRLATLPDWLFGMPKLRHVKARYNRFSQESVLFIQQQVQQVHHRLGRWIKCDVSIHDFDETQHSKGDNLEELVAFWEKEYEQAVQKLQQPGQTQAINTNALKKHPKNGHLFTFLQKATICEDFKNEETKFLIVLEIHETLNTMSEDTKFREVAFNLLEEGDQTCGDRIALFLNYLRVQRIITQSKDLNDLELAKLIIGIERLDQLDKISRKKARSAIDKVEIILGYQVKLRQTLGLPLATHAMLYPKLFDAAESELKAVAEQVRKNTKDTVGILCTYESWIDRIKEKNSDVFEKIDEKYQDLLASIVPKNEKDFKAQNDSILKQRKMAVQKAVAKCTQIWLDAHTQQMQF